MSGDTDGLSGPYALDAVGAQERAEFEAALADDQDIRDEVRGYSEIAVRLANLTATPCPPALREAVLRDIKRVRPLPSPRETAAGGGGKAPASQHKASAGSVLSFPPPQERGERRRRLAMRLASLAAAAAVILAVVVWHPWNQESTPPGQPSRADLVLSAPDAKRYQARMGPANATLVVSRSLGDAVLSTDRMLAAPAGKAYQMWFDIPGKGMVAAGVMPEGASGQVTRTVSGDLQRATGFGITVEPPGGSAHPSSKPVMLVAFV